jgi:hypothetical protein
MNKAVEDLIDNNNYYYLISYHVSSQHNQAEIMKKVIDIQSHVISAPKMAESMEEKTREDLKDKENQNKLSFPLWS